MSLWSRITNIFRTERLTREITEELESHLSEAAASGREPSEARRAFGSTLRIREESRDSRIIGWLDALRADAVFGWRQLRKTKVTSAAAILSLALTIGACTAAFRLIDALLLRPMPVANSERLHVIAFSNPGPTAPVETYDSCSYPMFRQMRGAVKEQAELIAVSYEDRVDLTYGSEIEMEKANLQYVSGWMFQTFGLTPAAGRLLTSGDDGEPGKHALAVVSYDYWSRRFGRDPRAVGRTFRLGDRLFEIVGVGPERFTGTETGTVTDVFAPLAMKNPQTLASWNNFWMRTFVALKPGVDPTSVYERLRATFRSIQEERAKGFGPMPKSRLEQHFAERLLLEPAAAGRSNLQRDYRRSLTALSVLVALVLLIACANVANLLTARAAARAREMALRVSIGAGRWRLVQLVLVESAWVAAIATALGAAFAWWCAPLIVGRINPPDDPARLDLPADWRVTLFALALALVVTFLFGLSPAIRASGVKPASALRGGSDPHSRRRVMHGLIALQVAFCFVVLFVTGLFATSLERLTSQPLGYSPARIVNLESVSRVPQPPVAWNQVMDHLRGLPGVETVALTKWPTMSGEAAISFVSIHGEPPNDVFTDVLTISPGWFKTMKTPFVDGRDLRSTDSDGRAVIVNEAFAKQFFGGENPVGQSFETIGSAGARTRLEIVGLVRDARSRDRLRVPIRPTAYLPFDAQRTSGRITFVVKTASANPLALASMLRHEVTKARPEIRVNNIRSQEEIVRAGTVRERLLAMLAMFFAGVALLLAGVGLYGVLDYSVLERRREIGIRIAIGADAIGIAHTVTAQAFVMVMIGAAVGIGLGLASVRSIETLLYQVRGTEASLLAAPGLAVLALSFVAAAVPAIRAVRLDPVTMLRGE